MPILDHLHADSGRQGQGKGQPYHVASAQGRDQQSPTAQPPSWIN